MLARLRSLPRAACALLVCGTALLQVGAAHAQPGDGASALTLFEEGKKLAAEGHYQEGCPKLLASYSLVQKLGTLLNLADCYEKSGRTASAWVRFIEAESIAERGGQTERAEFARTHAAALVPRLSRLVITVASPATEGLVVRRDGAIVDAAAFGTALPVDPGMHAIEASSPHRKTWRTNVDVALDATAEQTVVVPSLEAEPVVPSPVPLFPSFGASGASGGSEAPPSPASTSRTLAFVLGGVGIAATAASLVGGLIARNKYEDSNAEGGCLADRCSERGLEQRSSASTTAAVSTGLFIGGALLVGTGVTLYLTSRPRSPASSARASTAVSVGPTSIAWQATW